MAQKNNNAREFVPGGNFTGTSDRWFRVRISSATTNPNQYIKYSSTDGVTFTSLGAAAGIVATTPFAFTHGVTGYFERTGGATATHYELGDQWTFRCDTKLYARDMVDINLINDQGVHHIIYAKNNGVGIIKDAYGDSEVRKAFETPQTDRNHITMNTKNRDTYIGLGSEHTPLYVGVPNHSQFGDIKPDFITESAALDIQENCIGYFVKSLYENLSSVDTIWGFEKNSVYLKKVTLGGSSSVTQYDMKKIIRSVCWSDDNAHIYVLTESSMWGKVLKVDKTNGTIVASANIKPGGSYPSPGSYLSDLHHMEDKIWLSMHSPTKLYAKEQLVYHMNQPSAMDQENDITNVTPQMSTKQVEDATRADETTPSSGTWVNEITVLELERFISSNRDNDPNQVPDDYVEEGDSTITRVPGKAGGWTLEFPFTYYNTDKANTNDHASLLWIFNYQPHFETFDSDDTGGGGEFTETTTDKRLFWDGTTYHSLGTTAHVLGRYREAQDADPTDRQRNDKCPRFMLSPDDKTATYTIPKREQKKKWDVRSVASIKNDVGDTKPAIDFIISLKDKHKKYEVTAAMAFGTANETDAVWLAEDSEVSGGNEARFASGDYDDATNWHMILCFQTGSSVFKKSQWLQADDTYAVSTVAIAQLMQIGIVSESSGDDVFGATDGEHNYYKVSYIYDGFQESPLIESGRKPVLQNKKKKTITVRIDPDVLPARVSAIRVYRGNNSSQEVSPAPDPDRPDRNYRMIKDLPLDDGIWVYEAGLYKAEFEDTGKQGVSYNAIVGINETIDTMNMNYSISCEHNGYLVVGQCGHSRIWDIGNYIFKSKPSCYSQFDYTRDYLALSGQPTALTSFNGAVYAFDKARTWIIDMDRLYAKDEFLGAGCWSQRAVVSTDLGMFHFDANNIYHNTGSGSSPIGTQIVKSNSTELEAYAWHNLDLDMINPILQYDASRKSLVIFFEDPLGDYGRAWVYNLLVKRWDLWTSEKITGATHGKDGEIIATNGRNIIQYAMGAKKKDWEWQTKKMSIGNDTIKKFFKRVRTLGAGSPEVKYRTSGANYSALTGSPAEDVSASDRKHYDIQVQLKSRSGQGDVDEVDSLGIIYRPLSPR